MTDCGGAKLAFKAGFSWHWRRAPEFSCSQIYHWASYRMGTFQHMACLGTQTKVHRNEMHLNYIWYLDIEKPKLYTSIFFGLSWLVNMETDLNTQTLSDTSPSRHLINPYLEATVLDNLIIENTVATSSTQRFRSATKIWWWLYHSALRLVSPRQSTTDLLRWKTVLLYAEPEWRFHNLRQPK